MQLETVIEALRMLEELRNRPFQELAEDPLLKGSVLWYLYTAVQGCIDPALKTISRLGLRTPESYVDAFTVLAEAGIIPDDLASSLIAIPRFRHILAHGYARIEFKRAYDILHSNLRDIESFLRAMIAKLPELGIRLEEL